MASPHTMRAAGSIGLNQLEDAADARDQFNLDVQTDRNRARFVYCATNKVADELNNRLQRVRFSASASDFGVYNRDRGRIKLYPGDRVQFHVTDRRLGIMNGQVGNVVSMAPDEIVVDIENGGRVSFNPGQL